MRALIPVSVLIAALGVGGLARADFTMRCGSGRVVTVGDDAWHVRAACGAPDHADRRRIVRTLVARRAAARDAALSIEVTIDEWTYDAGPDRLVRLLRFEDGRLVRIETRGFGRR